MILKSGLIPPSPLSVFGAATDSLLSLPDDPCVAHTSRVTLIVAGSYVVAIAIREHVPILEKLLYPFKLLVVGMHELCHALAGVLTCAKIESIELDPNEGGSTRMRGGIPAITLPAGYLGSSLIGAALITVGFDTSASKVAAIVLLVLWAITLYWARRSWVAYATILMMAALIVITWLVAHSVALRFFILFIGVMSCLYAIWDIIDDTLARKVNSSDASEYAHLIGCCGSRFWGAFWLLQACVFFVAGILVGIVVFRDSWEQQRERADRFLGGKSTTASLVLTILRHSLNTAGTILVDQRANAMSVFCPYWTPHYRHPLLPPGGDRRDPP
ncbi:peptidase M50B-like-domain-containing protein [Kockovaella imperatae]|uniref:Peptidase M50B-like-domain-containing protein n=1 Tax=Kockovaella imperatae TaxID=4999 RepID=A0A1Y1UE80_9TREE|nr:peptidase M50B-like-domain-containing protein [Kockovaella imperatae]ORX36299.1 peptidase M50B-like-domain-containing protein [Kockovaella imperatae]